MTATPIKLAGETGSLAHQNVTVGEFRQEMAKVVDGFRQVIGQAGLSTTALADPLTAPFTLFVNPYIGQDTFVGGNYNAYEAPGSSTDDEKIEAKVKRLAKQRLVCGFSPQRPFKTINRAVIEAAIITSKDWYTFTDPKAHLDCVSIVLSTGHHTVYNDPGVGLPATWTENYEPTVAELIKFNPSSGGILLPRGCSMWCLDLRKASLRPNWVPNNEDEAADFSNRSEMFKVTGTGYFYGFTIFDKVGLNRSHHLLSGFGFASKSELDTFYQKVRNKVGSPANLSNALTVTRKTEYEIVGPIDDTPAQDWDTTASASPYIFNCSIRSNYGIGGIHADGSKVTGIKSFVTAQYTGVSLQTDLSCWEIYSSNSWSQPANYNAYINAEPDNTRMKPSRRSYHIRAVNNGFIQEVSVFAIGQGVHHATASGGEITLTNSNSSFGGCAAISTGYKSSAFSYDKKWRIAYIKVPLNPKEKQNNIRKIYLGQVGTYSDSRLWVILKNNLAGTSSDKPTILENEGYALKSGSYIWVENPNGPDWRAQLADIAWTPSTPNRINLSSAGGLVTNDGESPGLAPNSGINRAVSRRIYIRRLIDTRSIDELKLTVGMFSTDPKTRFAKRNHILQLSPSESGSNVNGTLSDTEPITISKVKKASINPRDYSGFTLYKQMEVQLKRTNPNISYSTNTFYRKGVTVKYNNKHYTSTKDTTTKSRGGPGDDWQESYVHMPSDYAANEKIDDQSYRLIFDDDRDGAEDSTTLGLGLNTVWTASSPSGTTKEIQEQYRSSNDYQGAYQLLRRLGFSGSASHTALQPRAQSDRILRTNSSSHFPTAPSGGKATRRNAWAAEFRRPSVIRLISGHAFEWAGTLNYSKGFPPAQRALSPLNQFTYYFTNELGGRVIVDGSNEEGYRIKRTGVEDLDTGQSQSFIALATEDQELVSEFPDGIVAGGQSTFNDVEITGNLIYSPTVTSAKLSTDDNPLGPVTLATFEDLSVTRVPTTNRALVDGNLPKAVTNLGLNYWRNDIEILTRPDLQFLTGTDPNEIPFSGMLGRQAFVDEWCGYAEGGGKVRQSTSKSTAIRLNKICGEITLHNQQLDAGTAVSFTFNNTQIAESDVIQLNLKSGGTAGAYALSTLDITGNSTKIVVRNLTDNDLSEALVINFVIIKSTSTL